MLCVASAFVVATHGEIVSTAATPFSAEVTRVSALLAAELLHIE
ncbi:hypothetical protein [Actinomyces sp. W5033]